MSSKQLQKRAAELREQVAHHNYRYHVLDEPEGVRGEGDLEARIFEHREILDVRFDQAELNLLGSCEGPGMVQLFRREVDRGDPRPLPGEIGGRLSTAAADFQDVLSGNGWPKGLQIPFRGHRRSPQDVVFQFGAMARLVGAACGVPTLTVRSCVW